MSPTWWPWTAAAAAARLRHPAGTADWEQVIQAWRGYNGHGRCASATPPPIKSQHEIYGSVVLAASPLFSTSACRARATNRYTPCWSSWGRAALERSRSSPTPVSGSFAAARASTPTPRPCARRPATGFPASGVVSGLRRERGARGSAPPTVYAKTFFGVAGTPIASPSLIVLTARTSMRASFSCISLASSRPRPAFRFDR